jgi:hypothetical protein
MKRIFNAVTFAIVITMFSIAGFTQPTTDVQDAAAAKRLLGKHMFSLQWISWDYFGSAMVTRKDGLYSIKGEQKGRGNSDIVTLVGEIETIKPKEFKMNGTITTKISHINNGEPCVREGEFTFKITGSRKYWRLQEMDNPCDTAADYVDIFFR